MTPERLYQPEFEPKRPRLIYIAHIDFVHPELRWQQSELNLTGEIDRYVEGVLDNMAPASILFALQDELLGKIHWTRDEEGSMKNSQRIAKEVIKQYKPAGEHRFGNERSWLPTVCVLEITEVNRDCDISIENPIFIDVRRIKKALDRVPDLTYRINPTGGWSEIWRMAEQAIPSFELCLPISGDSHTYQSFVAVEKIGKYKDALRAIDFEFAL